MRIHATSGTSQIVLNPEPTQCKPDDDHFCAGEVAIEMTFFDEQDNAVAVTVDLDGLAALRDDMAAHLERILAMLVSVSAGLIPRDQVMQPLIEKHKTQNEFTDIIDKNWKAE